MEREGENIEFDPERAEEVKERLSTLYRLLKKHKASDLKELLVIQENLQQKDHITSNLDEVLQKARDTYDDAFRTATATALKISASRKKVFSSLCKQLTNLLHDLGIPNATLQIESIETELSSQGLDEIDILFSANKGIAPRPLAQVASGGEFQG